MSQTRTGLAELASIATREVARLQRVDSVDLRSELRFRIWPFLADLTAHLNELSGEVSQIAAVGGDAAPPAVPVDVAARVVGLVLALGNELATLLPRERMDEFAERTAAALDELLSLCDPDELAAYIAASTPPPHDDDVIDVEAIEIAPATPEPAAVIGDANGPALQPVEVQP